MSTYANYDLTISGNPIQAKQVFDVIYREGSDYVDYDYAKGYQRDDGSYFISVCQKTWWLHENPLENLLKDYPDVIVVETVFCDDGDYWAYTKTYKDGLTTETEIALMFKHLVTIESGDLDSTLHSLKSCLDGYEHSSITVENNEVRFTTLEQPLFISNDWIDDKFANCSLELTWKLDESCGLGDRWNTWDFQF